MNTLEHKTFKGVAPAAPPAQGRKFAIYTKDFTSVDQGVPVPLVLGRPKGLAGIQMTPIFGFRSEAIRTKAGK